MLSELKNKVLVEKTPVLGVCVGMQILADSSEEGTEPGLGFIEARVKKLDFTGNKFLRYPHMGWNNVEHSGGALFTNIAQNSKFYFLHSYYFEGLPEQESAHAQYGARFCCAVHHQNVYGVQFHPEKSHQNGVNLILNFLNHT